MTPIELFHEARLGEALEAQRAVVAAHPDDVAERLLWCELLAFTGDREAVGRELAALPRVPADVQDFVSEWQRLLRADQARHDGRPPDCLPEPTSHLQMRMRADCHSISFDAGAAPDLLDDADERAPWVEGYVDGRPFEGWRDADDVLGPVLEVFRGDRFTWIGLDFVRKLRLDEGEQLRDMLFRPATLWLTDGSEHEVFIPGLYVGTADHPEEGIRTGAGVDWVERGEVMRGVGGRTFLFGDEELTLAEFRQVEVRA